jgi:hypothetical protein
VETTSALTESAYETFCLDESHNSQEIVAFKQPSLFLRA